MHLFVSISFIPLCVRKIFRQGSSEQKSSWDLRTRQISECFPFYKLLVSELEVPQTPMPSLPFLITPF